MIDTTTISEKIYNVLKGFGLRVTRLDSEGNVTLNSSEARRFVVADPNITVRFSPDRKVIALMTGPGEVEEKIRKMLQQTAKESLYSFDYRRFAKKISPRGEQSDIAKSQESGEVMEHRLAELRKLAGLSEAPIAGASDQFSALNQVLADFESECESQDYYGSVDARLIQRYLDRDDIQGAAEEMAAAMSDRNGGEAPDEVFDLALELLAEFTADEHVQEDQDEIHELPANKVAGHQGVSESTDVMEGLGHMYGSRKTSYQPVGENVKLVVRHRAGVNEESRGARSRNIKEIYVQRGDERFRLPDNNLSAARAMARHVQQGGEVFDSIGVSIMAMATEYRKLREFVNYVNKRGLVNESNEEYVQLARESISEIRESFHKLTGVRTYANAVENIQSRNSVEVLGEEEELVSAFTETHFDDRVAEALESIRVAKGRRAAYQNKISEAIACESFDGFRDRMLESDVLTFEDANQQLAHRVNGLGMCAESSHLRTFLNGVSNKIAEGSSLSAFERQCVSECLSKLRGSSSKVTESVDPLKKFTDFITSCDIG